MDPGTEQLRSDEAPHAVSRTIYSGDIQLSAGDGKQPGFQAGGEVCGHRVFQESQAAKERSLGNDDDVETPALSLLQICFFSLVAMILSCARCA